MKKEEFSKTSLHNHFGGKSADYRMNDKDKHSFDVNFAKSKIDEAEKYEYELLAMTNSNYFWELEYNQLREYIEKQNYNIELLPGVELNVVNDNPLNSSNFKYLHLLIILSPKSALKVFQQKLDEFRCGNGKNFYTIEQISEISINYKCILIPHGNKQNKDERDSASNHPTFDNILSLKDFIPIMIEDNSPAQRKRLEFKIKDLINEDKFEWIENTAASISSLDRLKDFSEIKYPTYIWGENSFDALFYSAIIGKDRVLRESDIMNKSKYVTQIIIKNKGGILQDSSMKLSHGLNSIIGNSGSGKTLLLNLIKLKLTGDNLLNAVSSTNSNYGNMYENTDIEILDNKGDQVFPNEINVFEGENLYRQIVASINYDKDKLLVDLDANPSYTKTEVILNSFNKKLHNYITTRISINEKLESIDKSLLKINSSSEYLRNNFSDQDSIEYLVDPILNTKKDKFEEELEQLKIDRSYASNNYNSLNNLLDKYNLKVRQKELKMIYFQLLKEMALKNIDIEKSYNYLEFKILSSNKLSKITNEFNKTTGERAKVAIESKQIIFDEVEKILNSLKKISLAQVALEIPIISKSELLQSVKSNGDIIKLENYRVDEEVVYDDFPHFFESTIGSSINKLNKTKFSEFRETPFKIFDKDSIKKLADIFVEEKYTSNSIFNIVPKQLVKFDIMIKNLDNKYERIDSLSAGQLSKIYINVLIESKLKDMENNAIILYDQPDNNLEKTFILETLGRKLAELKKKYQIIITTHEPLLVVNSDSNNIIRAINDPVAGKNDIKYENLFMYDVQDKQKAVDKIARLIDGSHKAIKVRNQIYGGTEL